MLKVLCYPQIPLSQDTGYEMIHHNSLEEFVQSLVTITDCRAAVLSFYQSQDNSVTFLRSLHSHFPLLPVLAVIPRKESLSDLPFKLLSTTVAPRQIESEIQDFIRMSENKDCRKSNRFSWPLTASFSIDGENWQETEIHTISSGGAYLKTNSIFTAPGDTGHLAIQFADSSIITEVVVRGNYGASSKLPVGFGVEFQELPENIRIQLNQFVNDAIIQILLDPDSQPEVPTITTDPDESQFSFDL